MGKRWHPRRNHPSQHRDGWRSGTYVLADVSKAADSATVGFNSGIGVLGDHVIFTADDGRTGPELWEAPTDTVPAHAQILVPPNPRLVPVDQLTITFNRPVTDLQLRDLALSRDGIPNLLAGSETLSTSDGITWTLNGIRPLTSTPGRYTLTVTADAGVRDENGEPFLTDANASFTIAQPFVLDFAYLLALAQHYNKPGDLADGDLNGDGRIDFSDLLLLAQNYGRSLAPAAASASSAARRINL